VWVAGVCAGENARDEEEEHGEGEDLHGCCKNVKQLIAGCSQRPCCFRPPSTCCLCRKKNLFAKTSGRLAPNIFA
jgi:hypothetical protein